MNIADIVSGSDDFDLLAGLLDTADLADALRDLDDITVFAPTDAGFATLAADLGYAGDAADDTAVGAFLTQALEDAGGGDAISLLTDILFYHVAPGTLDAADIASAASVGTLLDGIAITPEGGRLVDAEPHLTDPAIVQPDITADNGIVHGIDRVLVPLDLVPPSVYDLLVAGDPELDRNGISLALARALVDRAGLAATLEARGADITLLAPDDGAVRAAATALGFAGGTDAEVTAYLEDAFTLLARGADPVPLLADILSYHLVPGETNGAALLSSSTLSTVLGPQIVVNGFELVDLEPDLPDPAIEATDIAASNGVVHVIDGVLLPQDLLMSDGAGAVDFLIGDATGEVFDLGADADWAFGKGGDDRFVGGDGHDVMLGGEGTDTAAYAGPSILFGLVIDGTTVEITDTAGGGVDFLDGIERLEFGDGLALGAAGALDVATLGAAAALSDARISTLVETYIAYYDRAPDALGLLFWADAFASGVSLERVADLFFTQEETQAKLPDDFGELVDAAYNNLLERDADGAGRTFWEGALQSGGVTPGQFMLEVIRGARANPDGQGDVRTVENKAAIGIDYALFEGLNDVTNAEAVMEAYDRDDPAASLAAAAALTDSFAAAAAPGGGAPELTIRITGLVDDPFLV